MEAASRLLRSYDAVRLQTSSDIEDDRVHYNQEQSTDDIWRAIRSSVRRAVFESAIDKFSVKGIGFDATCSLVALDSTTSKPISVTGPSFDTDRNIILWLDHRPLEEAKAINATQHGLLRYVGGNMSVEMEIPKILWLKRHMSPDLFARCTFYDLADALTHLVTNQNTRSFCSTVCKQGYVPVGVDGSVKGWQAEFLRDIGLEDLTKDDFKRLGGVDGLVCLFPTCRTETAGKLI